MYFPIAVDGALVRAWELTLRSPQLAHFGQFHLAYSNQIAEQRGNIIGGFTCSHPTDPACDLGPDYIARRSRPAPHAEHRLHHEPAAPHMVLHQRVLRLRLHQRPCRRRPGPYNGAYLPVHTTFDVSAGHCFGERWKLSANVLNVTNHRVLLDNSVTIGGFHFNDPRIISAELRYRFHF